MKRCCILYLQHSYNNMQKSTFLLLAFLWVQVQVNAGYSFTNNQSNGGRMTQKKVKEQVEVILSA